MEKNKKRYELPTVHVVDIKNGNVICTSAGDAGLQNYHWNEYVEE